MVRPSAGVLRHCLRKRTLCRRDCRPPQCHKRTNEAPHGGASSSARRRNPPQDEDRCELPASGPAGAVNGTAAASPLNRLTQLI